jgi:hypothetical protein
MLGMLNKGIALRCSVACQDCKTKVFDMEQMQRIVSGLE